MPIFLLFQCSIIPLFHCLIDIFIFIRSDCIQLMLFFSWESIICILTNLHGQPDFDANDQEAQNWT